MKMESAVESGKRFSNSEICGPFGRNRSKWHGLSSGMMCCTVQESEILLLPEGWWHGTCNLADWTAGFAYFGRLEGLPPHIRAAHANSVAELDLALSSADGKSLKTNAHDALEVSACRGHLLLVSHLLSMYLNRVGTPKALECAAEEGHLSVVKFLFDTWLSKLPEKEILMLLGRSIVEIAEEVPEEHRAVADFLIAQSQPSASQARLAKQRQQIKQIQIVSSNVLEGGSSSEL
eukprot:gnl/MRDRNA2_/MRDRNA2_53949_c0_seq2.p1 gnl/MRDRNA2_/MRDRNA2_53949_c0~~gnl/MRDRNA2_/MRDRNA2_53949_c0_seq2.p1  ORF type:complete len:234 (+),score=52.36 gnl/MRDRNA2_/MRDRNA2_53949_c0_seq2:1-702(+)